MYKEGNAIKSKITIGIKVQINSRRWDSVMNLSRPEEMDTTTNR
jgi:hypothetical protein